MSAWVLRVVPTLKCQQQRDTLLLVFSNFDFDVYCISIYCQLLRLSKLPLHMFIANCQYINI